MAPTTPTVEPADVISGDSWHWDVSDTTYPPSEGWSLSYEFDGANAFTVDSSKITVDSTSDTYQVRLASTDTENFLPGTYKWASVFTKSSTGEKYTGTRHGTCVVRLNPTLYGEDETDAEKQLAAYRTARDAILDARVGEYTIHGRTFKYIDLPYINKMIGIYADQVRQEREAAKNGKATFGRQIRVQFTRPM